MKAGLFLLVFVMTGCTSPSALTDSAHFHAKNYHVIKKIAKQAAPPVVAPDHPISASTVSDRVLPEVRHSSMSTPLVSVHAREM